MLKPLTAALATTLLLGCASAETREAAPHDEETPNATIDTVRPDDPK